MIIQNFADYRIDSVNQIRSPKYKIESPLANILIKSPSSNNIPTSVKNKRTNSNSEFNTLERSIKKDSSIAKSKELRLLESPRDIHSGYYSSNIRSSDESHILNRNEEYFLEIQKANKMKEMKIYDIMNRMERIKNSKLEYLKNHHVENKKYRNMNLILDEEKKHPKNIYLTNFQPVENWGTQNLKIKERIIEKLNKIKSIDVDGEGEYINTNDLNADSITNLENANDSLSKNTYISKVTFLGNMHNNNSNNNNNSKSNKKEDSNNTNNTKENINENVVLIKAPKSSPKILPKNRHSLDIPKQDFLNLDKEQIKQIKENKHKKQGSAVSKAASSLYSGSPSRRISLYKKKMKRKSLLGANVNNPDYDDPQNIVDRQFAKLQKKEMLKDEKYRKLKVEQEVDQVVTRKYPENSVFENKMLYLRLGNGNVIEQLNTRISYQNIIQDTNCIRYLQQTSLNNMKEYD